MARRVEVHRLLDPFVEWQRQHADDDEAPAGTAKQHAARVKAWWPKFVKGQRLLAYMSYCADKGIKTVDKKKAAAWWKKLTPRQQLKAYQTVYSFFRG